MAAKDLGVCPATYRRRSMMASGDSAALGFSLTCVLAFVLAFKRSSPRLNTFRWNCGSWPYRPALDPIASRVPVLRVLFGLLPGSWCLLPPVTKRFAPVRRDACERSLVVFAGFPVVARAHPLSLWLLGR